MFAERFLATARFTVDAQDLVEEGHIAKEFTFSHPEELVLFLNLVEQARVQARVTFANDNNEIS
jgi:hypothetical protein